MIIRLSRNQITEWWPRVKEPIRLSLPPFAYGDPERMANILGELLKGEMNLWIDQEDDPENPGGFRSRGFLVTSLSVDNCSKVRNLLIYILYGLLDQPLSYLQPSFKALRQYAAAEGCHRIVAFTASNSVVEVARLLGMQAEWVYLTAEVGSCERSVSAPSNGSLAQL